MGDISKKKNPSQSEEQKSIEETSKGSILKHIPGISEGSLPISDEELEADYESEKLEWGPAEMEDEYLIEESQIDDQDEDDWSEEEDEYWEEDEEDDEEDKLRREYKKQESELKQRFKEGQ